MSRRVGTGGWRPSLFAVVATANSGGYRYGVSDQAFYVPAIAKGVDPSLFPRDSRAARRRSRDFWLGDDLLGGPRRATPASTCRSLFLAVYVADAGGAVRGGGRARARGSASRGGPSRRFLLLLTLRHRIAKTGANSLEGYMHPRMLAFALRRRGALRRPARARASWAAAWTIAAGVRASDDRALVRASCRAPAWRRRDPRGGARLVAGGVVAAAVAVLDAHRRSARRPAARSWTPPGSPCSPTRTTCFPPRGRRTPGSLTSPTRVILLLVYRRRRARGRHVARRRGARRRPARARRPSSCLGAAHGRARRAGGAAPGHPRLLAARTSSRLLYLAWWLIDDVARRSARRGAIVVVGLIAALAIGARRATCSRVETRSAAGAGRRCRTRAWTDAMTWLRTQPVVLARARRSRPRVEVRRRACGWPRVRDTVLEPARTRRWRCTIATWRCGWRTGSAALAGLRRSRRPTGVRALAARYGARRARRSTARARSTLPVLYQNARLRGLRPAMSVTDAAVA